MSRDEHAAALLADAKQVLGNERLIKTEEGRTIMALLVRLLEIGVDGEPKTPLPLRHHP